MELGAKATAIRQLTQAVTAGRITATETPARIERALSDARDATRLTEGAADDIRAQIPSDPPYERTAVRDLYDVIDKKLGTVPINRTDVPDPSATAVATAEAIGSLDVFRDADAAYEFFEEWLDRNRPFFNETVPRRAFSGAGGVSEQSAAALIEFADELFPLTLSQQLSEDVLGDAGGDGQATLGSGRSQSSTATDAPTTEPAETTSESRQFQLGDASTLSGAPDQIGEFSLLGLISPQAESDLERVVYTGPRMSRLAPDGDSDESLAVYAQEMEQTGWNITVGTINADDSLGRLLFVEEFNIPSRDAAINGLVTYIREDALDTVLSRRGLSSLPDAGGPSPVEFQEPMNEATRDRFAFLDEMNESMTIPIDPTTTGLPTSIGNFRLVQDDDDRIGYQGPLTSDGLQFVADPESVSRRDANERLYVEAATFSGRGNAADPTVNRRTEFTEGYTVFFHQATSPDAQVTPGTPVSDGGLSRQEAIARLTNFLAQRGSLLTDGQSADQMEAILLSGDAQSFGDLEAQVVSDGTTEETAEQMTLTDDTDTSGEPRRADTESFGDLRAERASTEETTDQMGLDGPAREETVRATEAAESRQNTTEDDTDEGQSTLMDNAKADIEVRVRADGSREVCLVNASEPLPDSAIAEASMQVTRVLGGGINAYDETIRIGTARFNDAKAFVNVDFNPDLVPLTYEGSDGDDSIIGSPEEREEARRRYKAARDDAHDSIEELGLTDNALNSRDR